MGWNTWEEINRTPNVAQVRNYGWPCYEGTPRMGSYDSLNLNSCETLYARARARSPRRTTRTTTPRRSSRARRARPARRRSPASRFYTGNAFPAAYQDALFFSDYSRNCIWVVYKGANGLPDMSTRQTFAAQANGPVWLTQGPDGALYYADLSGGTVRRIAADQQRADRAHRRRRRRPASRR